MTTAERITLDDLDRIVLKHGGHRSRDFDSVCMMEAVAWFAGKPHSDRPPCVSPVIADLLRSWNDAKVVPGPDAWAVFLKILKACADVADLVIPVEGAVQGVIGIAHG